MNKIHSNKKYQTVALTSARMYVQSPWKLYDFPSNVVMWDPPSTEHVPGQSFSVQLHWFEVHVLTQGKYEVKKINTQTKHIDKPPWKWLGAWLASVTNWKSLCQPSNPENMSNCVLMIYKMIGQTLERKNRIHVWRKSSYNFKRFRYWRHWVFLTILYSCWWSFGRCDRFHHRECRSTDPVRCTLDQSDHPGPNLQRICSSAYLEKRSF